MDRQEGSRKRVTINDIARVSGYSKTAVSFAFNDPGKISTEARNIIHAVAEQLGYYPDPLARKFSLQRHESVGFLLPQDFHHSFRNPYIMRVIEGIGAECQRQGFNLTLIPPVGASVIQAVRKAAVDAMIIQGMNAHMELAKEIARRAVPFVTIDGVPTAGSAAVNIDDRQAACDIMRTVLDAGHRQLAIVSLPKVTYEESELETITERRLEGYAQALGERGIDLYGPSIIHLATDCTLEGGFGIARDMPRGNGRPTCILAMSDIVAIGISLGLAQQGLRIPSDISLVGFDGIQEATYVSPALTTVSQPSFEKGERAAELLFSLMHGDPPCHLALPYHLIVRDSLSPPGSHT